MSTNDRHPRRPARQAPAALGSGRRRLAPWLLALASAPAFAVNAPTLTAPAQSTGSYTVSWSDTGDVFRLEESANGGASWTSPTGWTSSLSRSFTKSADAHYRYRVKACLALEGDNYTSCSANSSVKTVEVYVQPTGVPKIGCSGCTVPDTNGDLTITWTRPQGTVTHYRVFSRRNGQMPWNVAYIDDADTLARQYNDLASGTWEFQVDACNTLLNTNCSLNDSAIKTVAVGPAGTPRPVCSAAKIQYDLLAAPSTSDPKAHDSQTVMDCSATLPGNATVTKLVRFIGEESSGLTFDCNGGAIDPVFKRQDAAVDFLPRRKSTAAGDYVYEPPHDIVLKNCEVEGSVRLSSSYYIPNDEEEFIGYKNKTGPDYVEQIRASSTHHVVLDNLAIANRDYRENTVYFEQGVMFSKLKNSSVFHDAQGVALYIAPESGFNTIENNVFHNDSHNNRETVALDGTEGNTIERNWFSGLRDGGVNLYRNCGEEGQYRYLGAWENDIVDNVFYYDNTIGPEPAVWIGSKNGDSGTFWPWPIGWQCDTVDDGKTWDIGHVDPSWGWDADWESSSTVDYDYARRNVVAYNRTCNRSTSGMFKVTNAGFNWGNLIFSNASIDCPSSTPFPR